jgi:hypothetical protein
MHDNGLVVCYCPPSTPRTCVDSNLISDGDRTISSSKVKHGLPALTHTGANSEHVATCREENATDGSSIWTKLQSFYCDKGLLVRKRTEEQ